MKTIRRSYPMVLFFALLAGTYAYAEVEVSGPLRSVVLMPRGELKVILPQGASPITGMSEILVKTEDGNWKARALEQPGMYPVKLQHNGVDDIVLKVIVLEPFDAQNSTQLNNYEIGSYPSEPFKGLEQYRSPPGLIRISESQLSESLTPHVRVSDVICKQASGFPKYIYITNEALTMLEQLLTFVNDNGITTERFSFISGYRTPYYNRSIGNGRHSRHQYGDAFDLYVDNDKDGRMDDLNGDGKLTVDDVAILYGVFEQFMKQSGYVGGLGRYRPTSNHGGFVHIDIRGYRARW
ncbi:hypothetical protein DXV75_15505 [Alteromonas aestuariivivens]|uniref:Peptidase M15A C-terminal domain-containing protein n=1 Tax=Alteromonas aestuariivivens TaxID=1938339 RepID=A0A3D8M2Z9_9ALTE|nr:D-Ala-D-Ala carboxypeptidase family metallohydrolase [Alteromonas aestuariivivens]RDV24093.1 hypothetical protein DXV75_15505 [Alteromonas aestuariivivens]